MNHSIPRLTQGMSRNEVTKTVQSMGFPSIAEQLDIIRRDKVLQQQREVKEALKQEIKKLKERQSKQRQLTRHLRKVFLIKS